jgi:hypothetical protein
VVGEPPSSVGAVQPILIEVGESKLNLTIFVGLYGAYAATNVNISVEEPVPTKFIAATVNLYD